MWGRLVAPQRGQMLRDGAKTRHADARRIRVFDFDIFFFGTGILAFLVLPLRAARGPRVSVQARAITGPPTQAQHASGNQSLNRSSDKPAHRRSTGPSPSTSAGKRSGSGPRQSGRHSGARGRFNTIA